jgi:hypothetical protein
LSATPPQPEVRHLEVHVVDRGQGRTGGALELFQAKRQDLFEVLLEFVDRAALGVRAEALPFFRRSGS